MKNQTRICLVFSLLLLTSTMLFAQQTAIIYCDPQMDPKAHVPMWTSPGRPYVVEQLSCGQPVSFLGMESGYCKIQVGEKIGYVESKYLRLNQPTSPEPTPRKDTAAKSAPVAAPLPQESPEQVVKPFPRAELFGGYNYVHLDGGAGWMDGWNAAISRNFHQTVGIKAELTGLYAKNTLYNGVRYNAYSFMAGPEFSGRGRSFMGFGHVLFGVAHFGESAPLFGVRITSSVNGFAMAIGGGIDWHGQRKIAWRIAQIDYVPFLADGYIYSNIRISTGIVARFR